MKMLKGKLAAFCIILAMGIAGIGAGTVATTNVSSNVAYAGCENDGCVDDGQMRVQEEYCLDGAESLGCDKTGENSCRTYRC